MVNRALDKQEEHRAAMMNPMGRRLNDTETLLWSLGHNPHLSSTMGAIVVLKGTPDPERARATMQRAVINVAGLRDRVREPSVPLSHLEWAVDADLDLDHHLRFLRLPAHSTLDDLHALAAQILHDPFDRTRPLWQITVISGMRGGKSVAVVKLHHSIADGQGALKLAEHLLEFEPDLPDPPSIDLPAALATLAEDDGEPPRGIGGSLLRGASQLLGLLNDAAGTGAEAIGAARALVDQVPGNDVSGSALWSNRSRNRRYHAITVPLEDLKQAAKARSVSLNDVFVAVAAEAALAHHAARDVELPSLTATVIVSTRHDGMADNANAFLPVVVSIPGHGATIEDRLESIRTQVSEKREVARNQPDLMGLLGGIVGIVPTSIVSALALSQTSRVDLATSNLPGPPIPVWLFGKKATSILPVGPLAGTAANITLMTYENKASIGVYLDPAAVTDGEAFVDDLRRSVSSLSGPAPKTR